MMSTIQPNINATLKPATFSTPNIKTFKQSMTTFPRTITSSSLKLSSSKVSHCKRNFTTFVSSEANAEAVIEEIPLATDDFFTPNIEKLGVVVNPMEKPRLVLKFVWMEKNIGLALDQAIPGHGTIPLSPYYFWPRKDAWEELKVLLESKPWISQKQMIILLNQATDIINLWQQSGGNLA